MYEAVDTPETEAGEAVVKVNAYADDNADAPDVNAFTTGYFTLTITCFDADATAVSSHGITVRSGA